MAEQFKIARQAWFRDYLAKPELGKDVEEMAKDGKNRLTIDLNEIRERSAEEYRHILDRPMDVLPAYEEALKSYIDNNSELDPKIGTYDAYNISVSGAFGSHRMCPQHMLSENLTQMVCVEGIVVKTSLVRPKVVKTVHYCEATESFSTYQYRDGTSFSSLGATGSSYKTKDENGNRLTTEFGLCQYKNHQKVYIQDMPERTKAGSMPRTIEVIVEGDLVDKCKPGDRVQMIGVYRALPPRGQGGISGIFRTTVIANNVIRIGMDDKKLESSADDIKNFRQIKKRPDLFELFSRSLAPCIYGHEYIKKAVALMLLGGVEKNLKNGAHIRGDINILMVGDPSTAKSQLLRAVKNIGPLVINTTGRGSSGVGLTAAVLRDKDTGERRLEAGAMVLADRGIVTIDEFDKMSDADRTAIHEVMEQQTVTIAKAGIHTSLNARCSVMAASNPIYGQYDRSITPAKNIALPDSLLSRFDLLFIVLDKLDSRLDRAISDHVMKMHRWEQKGMDDPLDFHDDDDEKEGDKKTEVFEKNDKFGAASKLRRGEKKLEYLTTDFLKKYLAWAKTRAGNRPPKLTDDAREMIASKYAALRQEDSTLTLPITARLLETMIRLSTAHAKLRVDTKVTEQDVVAVYKVLQFALTNDAAPMDEMQAAKQAAGVSADAGGMDVDGEDAPTQPSQTLRKRKKPDNHGSPEQMKSHKGTASSFARRKAMDEDEKEPAQQAQTVATKRTMTAFSKSLSKLWKTKRVQSIRAAEFYKTLKDTAEWSSLSKSDYDAMLAQLHAGNKIFLQGNEIHRI